jgi:hypothetical protein
MNLNENVFSEQITFSVQNEELNSFVSKTSQPIFFASTFEEFCLNIKHVK